MQADDVASLIPRIYEAALEPEHWPAVLAEIGRHAGDAAVYLCNVPLACQGYGTYWTHAFDPASVEAYKRDHSHPGYRGVAALLRAPVGRLFDRREVFPDDDDYLSDPANQAFLLPQGLFHGIFSPTFREGGALSAFLALRTRRQGEIEGEAVAALQVLMPHLYRAMAMHHRLHRLSSEAAALRAVVDRLSAALILVDGACQVRFANAAAERILSAGDGLRRVGGRLTLATPAEQRRLARLVELCRPAQLLERVYSGAHMAASRPAGEAPYGLFVAPAAGGAVTAWLPDAVAAVFLSDPLNGAGRGGSAWLRQHFGFTATEAEVARLVCEGRGMPHVAQALGITLNTARTHLKAIYAKTNTDHQAHLTRLILESAPPVGPDAATSE